MGINKLNDRQLFFTKHIYMRIIKPNNQQNDEKQNAKTNSSCVACYFFDSSNGTEQDYW